MEKPAYLRCLMHFLPALLSGWLLVACQSTPKPVLQLVDFENAYHSGDFDRAAQMADSLKKQITDAGLHWRIDSLMEISRRLQIDFSLTREEVISRINELNIVFSEEDLLQWEKENLLECIMINGERRYFRRTAGNLKLILAHREAVQSPDKVQEPDSFDQFRITHIRSILKNISGEGELVCPENITMNYMITIDPAVVADKGLVRCWMPFPRSDHGRQVLLGVSFTDPENRMIAPGDSPHRTIYFEKQPEPGKPLTFNTELTIKSFAQYFNLREMDILPYNKESGLYTTYTAEQPPHIIFDERIRSLSAEIVKEALAPDEIVRRIFYWIDANIPWAGALEYGLMPSMPSYVLDNRRGDCGMVTLLFMTLARYNGIPVRWQSGWMLHPGEVNLHDWCEVYYEGIGWVPLDMSFGLMPSENLQEREFYISGMDAYRFIVNHDIGAPLSPEKKYFRSEPWDFQRGELEWSGGNLYFDKWKYKMTVNYNAVR